MPVLSKAPIDSYDASGGLNTVSSSLSLAPNESRDIQNVDYFPIGGFSKRNGTTLLSASPSGTSAVTGLYMARYSLSGGTNLAFMTQGTKLYRMSGSLAGTWTDITGGLTITYAANNIWNFDILNDICVLGNGVDTPIQISSSGTASALSGGSIPFTSFRFCAQARGYMWYFVPIVGGTTFYDRGYFSDLNAPSTFTNSTQFIEVFKGQGGDVKGAIEYKTYFYVWKRHGIYQLIFQPTQVDSSGNLFPWVQNPNPVVPGVGSQSHRSIVKFTTPSTHPTPGEEYVFFVDQFGCPRVFDGAKTLAFSSRIGTSRDTGILSLTDMDHTRDAYAFAINYPSKNRILCFLSQSDSQQNVCWVLDYSTGFSITRYKFNVGFNAGAIFEKSDGTFKPFCGDYTGNTYELDSGTTDNGTAIVDYRIGPEHFNRSPSINSAWTEIDIRGQTGSSDQNIKVSYYLNGEDTPALTPSPFSLQDVQTEWGDGPPPMIWGESSWAKKGMVTRTSEIRVKSKTIRVKFESSNKVTDTYSIEGYSLWTDPLGSVQS